MGHQCTVTGHQRIFVGVNWGLTRVAVTMASDMATLRYRDGLCIPPKHTQVSAKRHPRSIAGVWAWKAAALTLGLPCLLMDHGENCGLEQMTPSIVRPPVGGEQFVSRGHVLRSRRHTSAYWHGHSPRSVAHRVPRDDPHKGRTLMSVRPLPSPCISMPTGRILRAGGGVCLLRCGLVPFVGVTDGAGRHIVGAVASGWAWRRGRRVGCGLRVMHNPS
jgi:hypothetical protein